MRSFSMVAVSLLVGVWAASAQPAYADEYQVYSCRTPAGAVAPTGGWSGSVSGSWMSDVDSCESGGSLTAALDGAVEQGANVSDAAWTFSAPGGTSIEAAKLWLAGEARTSRPYGTTVYWLAAPNDIYDAADIFDKCENAEEGCTVKGDPGVPMAKENLVEVPSSNLSGATHIYMNAACGGGNGTNCPAAGSGYSVWVSLYAADITLADNTPPTVSSVGGSLAAGGTLSGVGDISFSASDTGSGLYEAVFLIDGHAVSRQLLDPGDESCRDVGGTSSGMHAFLYPQPCPLALSDDLSFNTALAPEGSHLLTVQLLDAAGNATTILNRQVTFANNPANNPANAPANDVAIEPCSPTALRAPAGDANVSGQDKLTARWARTAKALRTSRYGAADRVTGRLTSSGGTGMAGAEIDVCETPSYDGAPTRHVGEARTGPTGQWSLTLPRHAPSAVLRFVYPNPQNDAIGLATAVLKLRVHAGIGLRIAPRLTSVGHTIHFSGTLHGAPIPPAGKQLVLEASSGGEWIQFDTIATNAKGRYHASYRFKFPGPVTYKFRALSRYEADFPFLNGTSNVVSVYER